MLQLDDSRTGTCSRCGQAGIGVACSYEYGVPQLPSYEQVRLGDDAGWNLFRVLGKDVFFCRECERRLLLESLVSGVGLEGRYKWLRRSGVYLTTAVIIAVLGLSESADKQPAAFAIAFVLSAIGGLRLFYGRLRGDPMALARLSLASERGRSGRAHGMNGALLELRLLQPLESAGRLDVSGVPATSLPASRRP